MFFKNLFNIYANDLQETEKKPKLVFIENILLPFIAS